MALDRFPRQRISLLVDTVRAICSVVLAMMIANHLTGAGSQVALMLLLLVMLSLNRFSLAGLSAGLAYTVDDDEYLDASSIMPMNRAGGHDHRRWFGRGHPAVRRRPAGH
ncbi:hypothetical protein FAM14222_002233 [Propionibacterium freudenreichii]|uniref:hypothetical protein n=1 Tax=Propionibacterium freudenreichii TaxID=1744 RepID=UPI00254A80D7|nr:hypothetical protein [Propionibacterium freudenreichii]MDK9593837.1 hypothetical protein [Propionibacterium freudenreichii]